MLWNIFIVAFVTLLSAISTARCQDITVSGELNYSVKQYTDESGLMQNSVKSLACDGNGFIWLTTENGLVRFDGHNFHVFDKTNTNLKGTRFNAIQPDIRNSNIFYAVGNGFEMLRIDKSVAVSDSLYLQRLKQIPHFDEKETVTFLASGSPKDLWKEVDPRHYIILSPHGKDRFFLLHRDKIEFFNNWKKQGELKIASPAFRHYFSMQGKLYKLEKSGKILGFKKNGTEQFTLGGDIVHDPGYKKGDRNLRIYWNNASDQVFILLNRNFYHIQRISDGTCITKLILTNFDFDINNILTVHYDLKHSRIFLGSLTRGLFVFSKTAFKTLRYGNMDMDNIFYAQTIYENKSILTPGGIVLGEQGTRQSPRIQQKLLPAIKANFKLDRRGIFTDKQGFIWVKTGTMLYRYTGKGDKLLNLWKLGDEIKTIYQGLDGRIWLGLKSKGLYYIQPYSKRKEAIPFLKLSVFNINFILQEKNKLWLSTERGLYNISLKTGVVSVLNGTEKIFVRSLYISPLSKGLYFTTYEDGIFLYKDNKLIQFPRDANGYLTVAHCISEDKKGFFWITTNKGLFQVLKNDLLEYARLTGKGLAVKKLPFYLYYAKDHGFKTNEFNGGCQPCSVKLPDGHLSLPSLNGLVWFKPESIRTEEPKGPLFIDRLDVSGKVQPITNDTILLSKSPKNISISVATAYFGDVDNVHLSYSISGQGLDSIMHWTKIKASDPVIRFSELRSGTFLLRVKKLNGFGDHNEIIRLVTIIVPRNWYETLWFQILCAGLVLMFMYTYIRFRIRYLRNQNQELEEKVNLRTKSLEQTLSALRSSEKELNRQMHIQSRLIASISHDIRTPLKYMISFAERIEGLIKKGDYDTVLEIGRGIDESGSKMYQLLENMIGYIKTQVYGGHLKEEKVFLRSLIAEKAGMFTQAINAQSNHFLNEVPVQLTIKTNPQLLGIIVHNLIDNANKYTYKGTISVSVEQYQNKMHLIIVDSGQGIPDVLVDWLNLSTDDPNEKSIPGSEEYSGLGLIIVKEVSSLLGIRIFAEKDNGTKVHMIFNRGQ